MEAVTSEQKRGGSSNSRVNTDCLPGAARQGAKHVPETALLVTLTEGDGYKRQLRHGEGKSLPQGCLAPEALLRASSGREKLQTLSIMAKAWRLEGTGSF